MSLHCFSIRALAPEPEQAAFNQFCAAERVLKFDRQFVADGAQSYWALCVEVADGAGRLPDALKRSARRGMAAADSAKPDQGSRPDYKQLLNEADFAVFAALRHWRKAQAAADGVPVYAVFTNDQLAALAQRRCASLAALGQIDGIGPARVQRYGAAVLQGLAQHGQPGAAVEPPQTAPGP